MEHLYSSPSLPAKIQIPYRECSRIQTYSGEERQGYFERYSCTADQIVAQYSTPLPDGRHEFLLCLIQNYCFFAFLRECLNTFDIYFLQNNFIREDDHGKKWLSTSMLPAYAHEICVARAKHVIADLNKRQTSMEVEAMHDTSDSFLASIGASDPNIQNAKSFLHKIWHLCNVQNRFLGRLQTSLTRRRGFVVFDDEDFQLIVACATLTETMWSLMKQLFPLEAKQMLATFHVNQSAIDIHARLKNGVQTELPI